MTIQRDPNLDPPSIEAELNYLVPMAEKPYRYNYWPPPGKPATNAAYISRTVRIHDARPIAKGLSLDRKGLARIGRATTVREFDNEDDIRRSYYPEAEDILKELTGATRVVLFDHTIRRAQPGAADRAGGPRRPVSRVHVDQTVTSLGRDLLATYLTRCEGLTSSY